MSGGGGARENKQSTGIVSRRAQGPNRVANYPDSNRLGIVGMAQRALGLGNPERGGITDPGPQRGYTDRVGGTPDTERKTAAPIAPLKRKPVRAAGLGSRGLSAPSPGGGNPGNTLG